MSSSPACRRKTQLLALVTATPVLAVVAAGCEETDATVTGRNDAATSTPVAGETTPVTATPSATTTVTAAPSETTTPSPAASNTPATSTTKHSEPVTEPAHVVVVSTTAELERAVAEVRSDTAIKVRAGTYYPKATLKSQASGTRDGRITVTAYGSEKVVIDGSNLPDGQWLMAIDGDYWTLSDLTFRNAPGHGVVVTSSVGGIFENLVTHHNKASGFTLTGDKTVGNLIKNLDSYGNYDPDNHGENADGLAIKFGSGSHNKVVGARLFNNSDDGIDLWAWESPVRIERSWAYGNGRDRWNDPAFDGDGNGFKLGGGGAVAEHVLIGNAAWYNTHHGFTANGNEGAMRLRRNTAYANGADGYFFVSTPSRLSHNLALRNGSKGANLGPRAITVANRWNADISVVRSTDPSTAYRPRQADGSLPQTTFLTTGTREFGAPMN